MASQTTDLATQLDALASYEALTIGDIVITRLPDSRIACGFRIDFMGTVDDEYCSLHARFVPDSLAVLEAIALPVTFTTPEPVLARIRALNAAARNCYSLRNGSAGETASDYEEMGDRFLSRSHALIREWE